MSRVIIIGNSGSGKSTLARALANATGIPILDLDTIYWEPGKIAVARDPLHARTDLEQFCTTHPHWIVEGCYGELAALALAWSPELILVNPGETACLSHCRNRPWEPHKYASRADQDSKLEFLLTWVSGYYTRDDDMSLKSHRALFDAYSGPKREVR